MPDVKLYDYQRVPNAPEGTMNIAYWTPERKMKDFLASRAPWHDGPMMCGFYNKDKELLGVRFIFMDGTYKDAGIREKSNG